MSEEGSETIRTAARREKGEGRGLSKELWTVIKYYNAMTDLNVDDAIFHEVKVVVGGNDQTTLELRK